MKFNINGKEIEVSNDDLKSALETERESLELKADFVIRTKEEDETYKNNLTESAQSVGIEIGRKNILKGLEISVDGAHKDDAKALEVVNSFINSKVENSLKEANINPDKKVTELSKDIEMLRNNLESKQGEYDNLFNEFNGYKKNQVINGTLKSILSEKETLLPAEDMITLLSTKIKVDVNEQGQPFALGHDGLPFKNPTTLEQLPLKEVINTFFNDNPQYLKGVSGGAGGNDSKANAGNVQSVEDFITEMRDKNIYVNSPEFNAEKSKRVEAGVLKL